MKPDTRPAAYGYVRLDEPDIAAIARFRQEIGAHCVRDGLRLVTTFCDLDDDGSTVARPGLADLLEALNSAPSAIVLVPELAHLSPLALIRSALLLLLRRTEQQLVVVGVPNGRIDELGVAVDHVRLGDSEDRT